MTEASVMKLWVISQSVNQDYDTYDAAVVAAETEEAARNTSPSEYSHDSWCAPEHIKVDYIGTAKPGTEAGVILASFNAG
jgi:hypothetical protein